MSAPVLDYTPANQPVRPRKAIRAVLALAACIGLFYAGRVALSEARFSREERRLRTANAPQSLWPAGASPAINANGRLLLPDGRIAVVSEMQDLPRRQVAAGNWAAEFGTAITQLRASQVGFTVVGSDPSGLPVVQVWVLSPLAYNGMCGNSSADERREGRMLLWRNVGAYLVQRGQLPYPEHTPVGPVSVIGW